MYMCGLLTVRTSIVTLTGTPPDLTGRAPRPGGPARRGAAPRRGARGGGGGGGGGPGPMEGSMEEGDRIGFEGSGGGGTWIKRRI